MIRLSAERTRKKRTGSSMSKANAAQPPILNHPRALSDKKKREQQSVVGMRILSTALQTNSIART